VKLLEYRYAQVELSQKDESRAQSADSSKAYRKPQARNQLGTPGGAKSFLGGAQNF